MNAAHRRHSDCPLLARRKWKSAGETQPNASTALDARPDAAPSSRASHAPTATDATATKRADDLGASTRKPSMLRQLTGRIRRIRQPSPSAPADAHLRAAAALTEAADESGATAGGEEPRALLSPTWTASPTALSAEEAFADATTLATPAATSVDGTAATAPTSVTTTVLDTKPGYFPALTLTEDTSVAETEPYAFPPSAPSHPVDLGALGPPPSTLAPPPAYGQPSQQLTVDTRLFTFPASRQDSNDALLSPSSLRSEETDDALLSPSGPSAMADHPPFFDTHRSTASPLPRAEAAPAGALAPICTDCADAPSAPLSPSSVFSFGSDCTHSSASSKSSGSCTSATCRACVAGSTQFPARRRSDPTQLKSSWFARSHAAAAANKARRASARASSSSSSSTTTTATTTSTSSSSPAATSSYSSSSTTCSSLSKKGGTLGFLDALPLTTRMSGLFVRPFAPHSLSAAAGAPAPPAHRRRARSVSRFFLPLSSSSSSSKDGPSPSENPWRHSSADPSTWSPLDEDVPMRRNDRNTLRRLIIHEMATMEHNYTVNLHKLATTFEACLAEAALRADAMVARHQKHLAKITRAQASAAAAAAAAAAMAAAASPAPPSPSTSPRPRSPFRHHRLHLPSEPPASAPGDTADANNARAKHSPPPPPPNRTDDHHQQHAQHPDQHVGLASVPKKPVPACFLNARSLVHETKNPRFLPDWIHELRATSATLAGDLKHVCRFWSPENTGLGEIFLRHFQANRFDVYLRYCRDYTVVIDAVKRLKKSSLARSQADAMNRSTAEDNRLALKACLILPIQQLGRYPLWLRDLLKATPDTHGDYAGLAVAEQQMRDLARVANSFVERSDLDLL